MHRWLLCLLILLLGSCTKSVQGGLNPGSLAPQFSLNDLNQQNKSLLDFKGQKVLLNFWATWCEPCVEEAEHLEKLHRSLKSEGFTVLAVAVDDDLDSVKKFQKEKKLTFPILFDADGKVRDMYKVEGYPETFYIDQEGKIKLLLDPDTGYPELKIIGPRDWTSQEIVRQFQ